LIFKYENIDLLFSSFLKPLTLSDKNFRTDIQIIENETKVSISNTTKDNNRAKQSTIYTNYLPLLGNKPTSLLTASNTQVLTREVDK